MDLTQTKVNEAKTELKEWINNPISTEDLTVYGKDKIKEKLKEDFLPKSTLNGFESLDNWYSNNFVYEMLTTEQSSFRQEMARNGYHIIMLAGKFADIYPNRPPELLFDKTAYWLSNCLLQNWDNESETLIKIINKGLSTEMLDGGWEIKPSSWFILEIANKAFDIDADLSKFNYPDNMGVYKKALANWNTVDFTILDNVVTDLCDFHLENATYGKEETTPDIQFGDASWFVYAFEILTLLKAREIKGIPNPEKFSHPLMQLSINKLPANQLSVVDEDLFHKVMQRLNDQ